MASAIGGVGGRIAGPKVTITHDGTHSFPDVGGERGSHDEEACGKRPDGATMVQSVEPFDLPVGPAAGPLVSLPGRDMMRPIVVWTAAWFALSACGGDSVNQPDPGNGSPVPATVSVVSGSGQVAIAGELLPVALVAVVRDASGTPVPNVDVLWTVTGGGGSLNRTTVPTTSAGTATVTWTLGAAFGAVHTVEASVGGASSAVFTAEGTPAAVEVVSGSEQVAAVGDTLADPLVVLVTGGGGQPAAGVEVTWTVTGGGGVVSAVDTHTGSDGMASALWELGDLLGTGHSVRASANAPTAAEFTATGAIGAVWEPLTPLPTAVRSPGVATDGDRVYVVGGSSSGGRVMDVQILDLASGVWSAGGPIPLATDWPSVVWVGDSLHLVGGVADGTGYETQHLVYDTLSGNWTPSVAAPVAIAGTAYGTDASRIYLFAGNSNAYTSATHIFDVSGNSWSTGMDVPGSARINWSTVFSAGRFYMFGGGTSGLQTSADALAYDPVGDSWEPLPDLALAREAYGVGVLDGLVCVVGGRRAASGNTSPPFDDVACFDHAQSQWFAAPPLPAPRQEVVVVTTAQGLIAIGGADSSGSPVRDVTLLRMR